MHVCQSIFQRTSAETGNVTKSLSPVESTSEEVGNMTPSTSEEAVSKATPMSELQPATTSPADRLPKGWGSFMSEEDMAWIGKEVFSGKGRLVEKLKSWWYPPEPPKVSALVPNPQNYFLRPLFLWIPRKMWRIKITCVVCKDRELTSKGLYNRVRQVVDVSSSYFMATEYLECGSCKKTFISWSKDVISQLDPGHRAQFPAVLTYRLACDIKVVTLLRSRTLGNSSALLHHSLEEMHSEAWLRKLLLYLTDCEQHKSNVREGIMRTFLPSGSQQYLPPPPYPGTHTYKWLLACYTQDVLARLEEVKGQITSVYGSILKIDSTKKITKKLSGEAAGTAAWATNVGNEYGQVLMSVMTTSEGAGLQSMAEGIVRRYAEAGEDPPILLYVDRNCCSKTGQPSSALMFEPWDLTVRLDIYHFMRRFAVGFTTDAHPLYGIFMSWLSACIFLWDEGDFTTLKTAKRAEMAKEHRYPSDREVGAAINKREMQIHCRRVTRGEAETRRLIQDLLSKMQDMTDACGVPIIDKQKMDSIWEVQRKHLRCIQDPPNISLYVKTGTLRKGGMELPVYRCARGSVSLESFHLHMNRFIPGMHNLLSYKM